MKQSMRVIAQDICAHRNSNVEKTVVNVFCVCVSFPSTFCGMKDCSILTNYFDGFEIAYIFHGCECEYIKCFLSSNGM